MCTNLCDFKRNRSWLFSISWQVDIPQPYGELASSKTANYIAKYWHYKTIQVFCVIVESYGRWRESRVQCAAVNTYLVPIKEPPHQNSTRLSPCRKIAANHGHSPDSASSPPTTRPNRWECVKLMRKNDRMEIFNANVPDDTSCWPHWVSSTTFPVTSFILPMPESSGLTGLGGRDIVWTGNKTEGGRFVVVVKAVKCKVDCGLETISIKSKHSWNYSIFLVLTIYYIITFLWWNGQNPHHPQLDNTRQEWINAWNRVSPVNQIS